MPSVVATVVRGHAAAAHRPQHSHSFRRAVLLLCAMSIALLPLAVATGWVQWAHPEEAAVPVRDDRAAAEAAGSRPRRPRPDSGVLSAAAGADDRGSARHFSADPPPPPGGGAVMLYSDRHCGGHSVVVTHEAKEKNCASCFDLCGKHYSNGEKMHAERGSTVRSLRVTGKGWAVGTFALCSGTYEYGNKHDELHGVFAEGACHNLERKPDHVTLYGPGVARPRVPGVTEPRPPPLRRRRDSPAAGGTPKMFDMALTDAEREAAMDETIARLLPQTEGPAESLDVALLIQCAVLLMARKRWQDAERLLSTARSLDPFNWKARVYYAYALEGQRTNMLVRRNITDKVLGDLHNTGSWQAEELGLGDHFYWQAARLCCKGMPRWLAVQEPHCSLTMGTIAHLLAYMEWEFQRGAMTLPQMRTLLVSRGLDDRFSPADNLADTVERYAQNDIMVLRELYPAYFRHHLRKYYTTAFGYCTQTHPGSSELKCRESPNEIFPLGPDKYVRSISSDRVGFFLNELYRPLFEAIAGRKLQSTYSYFVRYLGLPGNPGLRPHIDMVDNEYTVTTSIDWTPEERGPVPIHAQVERVPFEEYGRTLTSGMLRGEHLTVNLSVGDAIVFRGRQHPHWRKPIPLGHTVANLLLHYAVAEFPNDMTREQHNTAVCCRWPPLEKFGNEDCRCHEPALAAKKRANRSMFSSAPRRERDENGNWPLAYGPVGALRGRVPSPSCTSGEV
eukprot:TRINITY_DN70867_c0_g1_i1.p1 TRINITY_DN70867_c0_g1~~TRINITY_DN70867_c0_g1_i1.p1  ORF type:complete len:731 (+),score=230.50 TRINITY_DN70867_c0_g1_i1:83-2275(+)